MGKVRIRIGVGKNGLWWSGFVSYHICSHKSVSNVPDSIYSTSDFTRRLIRSTCTRKPCRVLRVVLSHPSNQVRTIVAIERISFLPDRGRTLRVRPLPDNRTGGARRLSVLFPSTYVRCILHYRLYVCVFLLILHGRI